MQWILSFDLDGTLVKPGFADSVWLDGLPKVYAEKNEIPIEKAKHFFKEAYDTIGSDQREWYDLSFWIDKYNLNIMPETLLESYENHIELFEDVKPVLQRLSRDFTLIICSGAMQEFIQKELSYTRIKPYFRYTFSSTTDSKTVKKDPAFYTMIAEELRCPTKNIIHVGDNLDYDYYSPLQAGIHAFLLNRQAISKSSFIVASLEDFEHIVRNALFKNHL